MLAKVCSAAVNGTESFPVEAEVNSGWGNTVVVIVGLHDAAVKEARDGLRTALSNSGFKVPMGRTTINLGPAEWTHREQRLAARHSWPAVIIFLHLL